MSSSWNLLLAVCFAMTARRGICDDYKGFVTLRGGNDATVNVVIDEATDTVEITLTVESDRWVGCGFGGTKMANRYAIIGTDTTTIEERILVNRGEGSQLTSSLTVVNDTIANGLRTFVVTRAIDAGADYYNFSSIGHGDSISVIYGIGSDTTWDEHSNKGSRTLSFTGPTETPTSRPTMTPTGTTGMPTNGPSRTPSSMPTMAPADPTGSPTGMPSGMPSGTPTAGPTEPSLSPTQSPSGANTSSPTAQPTLSPSDPSMSPSMRPTGTPTSEPVTTLSPTGTPSAQPVTPTVALVASVSFESDSDADYELTCQIELYEDDTCVLTMTGPAGQWIGFGFGGVVMNGTFSFIIDGNGTVHQRVLGHHSSGRAVNEDNWGDVNETVNKEEDDTRTVVLTFDATELRYDFSGIDELDALEYILASSDAVALETHDWREAGSVSFGATTSTTEDGGNDDSNGAAKTMEFNSIVGHLVAVIVSVAAVARL